MTDPDRNGELPRRAVVKIGGAAGLGLITSVAGCLGGDSNSGAGGGDASGGSSSEPLVTDARIGTGSTELTYWALKPHSHQVGNESFAKTIETDFYATWAENHPDWTIDFELQPSYGQLQTKLAQTVAKGNAPEISLADSFWVPDFYESLTPVTDKLPDTDDWFEFVKDGAKHDGEWKTVWQNTDCRALYYRQDLMDEYNSGDPPKTWDELIDVGKRIIDGENMNGFMYNGGRWEGTTFDNLAYYWAQGGEILDENREPALGASENKEKLLNVFKFLKRTVDSGVTPQRVASIKDYALLSQAAMNDETAMFVGGSWQIQTLKDKHDNWENWKVTKIPQIEPDLSSTGAGGWTQSVFTSEENLVDAATDFTTMWADKERMASYCREGGYLPTRPSVYEEFEYFSEDSYQKTFGTLLEDASARPGGPVYKTFSSEFQIAAGNVLTGQASAQEAVDTLVENVLSEHGA
jgi:multiple sugar transport system substrate-binding protein